MTEQWLPVVGYEGKYEVSDHGRVRSIERKARLLHRHTKEEIFRRVPGRIIKLHMGITKQGKTKHMNARLSDERGTLNWAVHRLVLTAFRGPCPPGLQGCHYDDDPYNNRLENLRWDTQSANELDKVRNGGHHEARRDSCDNGHRFSEENTRMYRGKRKCRRCERDRSRAQRILAS